MIALLAPLWDILVSALGALVGRLIIGLGVGTVAYTGLSALNSQLLGYISSLFGQIDPIYMQAANVLGFTQAINILAAAYVARFGTSTAYRVALSRATPH